MLAERSMDFAPSTESRDRRFFDGGRWASLRVFCNQAGRMAVLSSRLKANANGGRNIPRSPRPLLLLLLIEPTEAFAAAADARASENRFGSSGVESHDRLSNRDIGPRHREPIGRLA
jgi:hypothetical protein